ncbi:hypothetical protein GCM10009682_27500 [Luedemannella flava]|uniref:Alpha-L-arabinofuranosidase B arabinose-binding domain-containing protein n=1 Tax=Luedemannella flava TaxID=349316 RepID=A0ABP4Y8W0_9ACTN
MAHACPRRPGRRHGPVASYGEQIYFSHSTDGLRWTDLNNGSILNLTAAESSRVLGRWGTSTPINRLQSYNFSDRYLRHANVDVRIDPNVSPAGDAQFRLVPGLANSSGYAGPGRRAPVTPSL